MNKNGFFIRPKEKEWRENVTNPLKIHLKGNSRLILREFYINNSITWSILVGINLTHVEYFYEKIDPKFRE